jgi:three-Cys-motif partner protein
VPGSAQIALDVSPPFDEYIFLEDNKKRAAQLETLTAEYPQLRSRVHRGDCNRYLPRLLTGSWTDRRAVLFLDSYGLQVDWTTVQAIAATRAIDVLFLVSISGVYRQAALDSLALDDSKIRALDRFLGTTDWQEAFYDRQAIGHTGDLFDADRRERTADWPDIARYIRERLSEIFAGGVSEPAILKMGNTPLFALYFAIANPSEKARKLAHHVVRDIMRLP